MNYGVIALAFIFGAIIGSFLNVVILRSFTGRSINGRSGCATCGKTLTWYELIPVVSFLVQRGRCRGCGAKVSWQYIIVELLTAFLFALTISQLQLSATWMSVCAVIVYLTIMSLLVVITVYDAKHKIIPNPFVYSLIAVSGVFVVLDFTVTRLIAGPLLWLPFAALWYFSKGTWIGLGDAKLVWAFGWILGIVLGISAVVFGFWIGAVFGLVLLGYQRIRHSNNVTMKTEIPFGPFLILGFIIVLFSGVSATEAISFIVALV